MVPVVSVQEMRNLERLAESRAGIPTSVLMEYAGRGVVEAMERRYGPLTGRSVLIVAGKGNNGGDGFVAARHAFHKGAIVIVALLSPRGEIQGDARTNLTLAEELTGPRLSFLRVGNGPELKGSSFDFVIDAIFGTSFHGRVAGRHKKLIDWINSLEKTTVVAVDVPSGIDADLGRCETVAVQAELTVTMGFPKLGLFLDKGADASGAIAVADIRIPGSLANRLKPKTFLVAGEDVAQAMPRRPRTARKQSVGKIFTLAGSHGLTGAALLASTSALRSGAGAVILGTPAAAFPAIARRTLEVMPLELDSTEEGSLSMGALEEIRRQLKWADVLLIGPGLSRNPETRELIRRVIATSQKKMLIDADALNALAGNLAPLKNRKCREVILTPHLGEFSRLISRNAEEIELDKLNIARAFARKFRAVLVLKGAPSIVAGPEGEVFINSSGNPGMATAGSGDVLSGIIAALWGQGNTPLRAAINGVYVHGRAGDIARKEIGELGMIAGDIARRVPRALRFGDLRATPAVGRWSRPPRRRQRK